MELTQNQILKYWRDSVRMNNRTWTKRRKPKFLVAQTVRVRTVEPNLGAWSYMDSCRLERKGMKGIIIDMNSLPDTEVPPEYSNYDYRVKFSDGRVITFTEEHLTRSF